MQTCQTRAKSEAVSQMNLLGEISEGVKPFLPDKKWPLSLYICRINLMSVQEREIEMSFGQKLFLDY